MNILLIDLQSLLRVREVRVSNKVRFAIWGGMIIGGLLVSKLLLDEVLIIRFNPLLSVSLGVVLLLIIMWVAGSTGRWLAQYGKISDSESFGDLSRLVKEGPYSCMRHPMHLFLSLFPISIGLIFSSPSMVLIVGPLETVLVLLMAVLIDEKESIERFKEEYIEYRKRVPAFNLNPQCLRLVFTRPSKKGKKNG